MLLEGCWASDFEFKLLFIEHFQEASCRGLMAGKAIL